MEKITNIHRYASLLFVLTFVTIFSLSIQTCLAESLEREESVLSIQKINSVPAFDSGEIDYDDIIDMQFENQGTLDAVYQDRIIVGDIEFALTDKHILSNVKLGDYVGVKLGEHDQVVLIKKIKNREFE